MSTVKFSQTGSLRRSMYVAMIIYIFFNDFTKANNTRCIPLESHTCRFGGQCTSITTFFFELGYQVEFSPDEYRCRCNVNFNCQDEDGFHPVYGDDGMFYYNDLCRRVQECVEQKPINVVCDGTNCGAISGSSSTSSRILYRCSEDDSNYCFNFGQCLTTSDGGKYCRCREGFFGARCNGLSVTGEIPTSEKILPRLIKRR